MFRDIEITHGICLFLVFFKMMSSELCFHKQEVKNSQLPSINTYMLHPLKSQNKNKDFSLFFGVLTFKEQQKIVCI